MRKFAEALDTLELSDYDNKKMSFSTTDGRPLRMQIPRMYMPFGLSGFTPEVGQTKWNIDFSMKGHDEEGNYVKSFYDTIRAIEEKVIQKVFEQSQEIFGEKKELSDIREMFNSNVKETPDREPKFRVKVDTNYEGRLKPLILDSEKNDIRRDAESGLYARNTGVAIVEVNSVYFLNKKFGITWKLHQLMTFEPQRLKGFQFV